MLNAPMLAFAVTDGAVRLTLASTCTGTPSRTASKTRDTPVLSVSPAGVEPPAGGSQNEAVFTPDQVNHAAGAQGAMAGGGSAGSPYRVEVLQPGTHHAR